MIRRISTLLVLCTLILSIFVYPQTSTEAATTAANPQLIAEVNGSGKGRVWVGSVPSNSSSKPVIVFVHGLHGKATNWWGETMYYGNNDMYQYAYNSGYRTAFVSLDDEVDGPASSMWANGNTLNRQLDVILNYYGVSSVNIVAHSKGGVDTNSAVVHYGASNKIQKIVTLSSPHDGSQLADLAYSWWAGWLATLLGQRDDGTYVMQSGYMDYFRSVTDSRSENNNVRFYTAGGTNHGPWFSAMWFGGGYISGSNDGVVTVASSYHPLQAGRLFTSSSLNHDNIRIGRDVWTRIEPTVRTTFRREEANSKTIEEGSAIIAEPTMANQILRGGEFIKGEAHASMPLESGITDVTFNMIGSNPDMQISMVGPKGTTYTAGSPIAADEVFAGAWYYPVQVANPSAGNWTMTAKGQGAYMLIASIEGGVQVEVQQPAQLAPRAKASITVLAPNARTLDVQASLTGTPMGQERSADLATNVPMRAVGQTSASPSFTAPTTVGLYQLGMTITGSVNGTSFERSYATNLPVMTGTERADMLPAGR